MTTPSGPGNDQLVGTTKPQPAPPLTDEELRLQCLGLVIQAKVDSRTITASAERAFQYVRNGIVSSGQSVGRNEGA